jgi:hypothetical protein
LETTVTAVEDQPDSDKLRVPSLWSRLRGPSQILFLCATLTLGWWISLLVLRPAGYGW